MWKEWSSFRNVRSVSRTSKSPGSVQRMCGTKWVPSNTTSGLTAQPVTASPSARTARAPHCTAIRDG